jgi:hypothetical protein
LRRLLRTVLARQNAPSIMAADFQVPQILQ